MLRWASTLWGGLGRRFMARKSPSGGGSSSASVDGAASGKEVFERVMGLERPGQAGVSPVQPEQAQRQREIALLYNQKRREQVCATVACHPFCDHPQRARLKETTIICLASRACVCVLFCGWGWLLHHGDANTVMMMTFLVAIIVVVMVMVYYCYCGDGDGDSGL
mgnify:CR=1 FL=1